MWNSIASSIPELANGPMIGLTLLYGVIVGFSLGLTGGGGSIFAVPLLIYGLSVNPREAVGASLAAVGATAFAGFLYRLARHEVEVATGLLFATTGMLGAPLGTWLNELIPVPVLLTGFAILMVIVAIRMWRRASLRPREVSVVRASTFPVPATDSGPTCRRDPEGKLHFTSACGALLAVLGFTTGILSGLFGVGGGFVIVPALVIFSGMGIHRAVATSLMIIALIGGTGVASYIVAQRPLNLELTAIFAAGGVLGMFLGSRAAARLSGPTLQKSFSVAMLLVAAFIVVKQIILVT